MKILVKIPTFKRPAKLFETLDSFVNNASSRYPIEYVITLNADDVLTNNPTVLNKLQTYRNLRYYLSDVRTKIEAYNADIDADADFDIFVGASDDMLVVTQDYDEILVSEMRKHFADTDGVLWFSTGDTEITDTLPIFGKAYYRRFHYLYHSSYRGYYCDDEFTRVAFKLGKLARVNKELIRHTIPPHLLMSDDCTYLKSMVHGCRDNAWYKIRRSVQFDCAEVGSSLNCLYATDFFKEQRKPDNKSWIISSNMYDEPLSGSEIYLLQNMDLKVAQMSLPDFQRFARSYFRNFRYDFPRIIHQIWLGKPNPQIKKMMHTFANDYLATYPGWRYVLWDEEKLASLSMINRDLYEQEPAYDCKSDIARLEILNQFGGLYLDSDFVWLGTKPIQSLFHFADRGLLLFAEKAGNTVGSGYLTHATTRCSNGCMGATIANPIVGFLLGQLRSSYQRNRKRGVVAATGPDFIQSFCKPLNLSIASHKYVYPVWFCKDPERNPDYDTFVKYADAQLSDIAKSHPDAVLFHKGWDK